jgi:hypothetical protein
MLRPPSATYRGGTITGPMPTIRLIPDLGALLVVVRERKEGGRVLVLVDADQPWRRIVSLCRPILWQHERRELARVLLTH